MGFYVTPQADTPSKNRVMGSRAFVPQRAPKVASQVAESHQEADGTCTKTVSGVRFYGFRYYSPTLGRFLNHDPIQETVYRRLGRIANKSSDAGLYLFVGNNPVSSFDLLGLLSCWIGGAGDKTKFLGQGPTYLVRDLMSANRSRTPDDDKYYGYNEKSQIVADIKKLGGCPHVNLIGHSYGGATAIDVASELKSSGIEVNILLTLDPVATLSRSNPVNQKRWINVYQTQSPADYISAIPWIGQAIGGVLGAVSFWTWGEGVGSDVIADFGGQLGSESGAENVSTSDRHFDVEGMFKKALGKNPEF